MGGIYGYNYAVHFIEQLFLWTLYKILCVWMLHSLARQLLPSVSVNVSVEHNTHVELKSQPI